jgi:hypothetical protein
MGSDIPPPREVYNPVMPSWIPQWNILMTKSLSPSEPSRCFAASQGIPLQRKHTDDPQKLIVRGVLVDSLDQLSRQCPKLYRRGPWSRARMNRPRILQVEKSYSIDDSNRVSLDDVLSAHTSAPVRELLKKRLPTRKDLEKMALMLTRVLLGRRISAPGRLFGLPTRRHSVGDSPQGDFRYFLSSPSSSS